MLEMRHWFAVAMTTIGALGVWGMGCTVSAGIRGDGCFLDDEPCEYDSDCCSDYCASDGFCGPAACNDDGYPCGFDSDCCGDYCAGDGYCGMADVCYADGDYCDYDSDCCNGYCAADGICG
jgi:hypothetical protein